MKKWDEEGKHEDLDLPTVTTWVQIHDLLPQLKHDSTVEAIASYIFPKFHRVDRSSLEHKGWRRFIRVLVEVELEEPVPIGFEYLEGDKSFWVSFNYEKVNELCYLCGRIGHQIHKCNIREEHREKRLSTKASKIYTAALKAGRESLASSHPPSFNQK
ncbi:unnamed protein product [Linum trigynum]|uniref:CCHC-type domain-containing protein n=1 Tax=Linum trigynum TaxID=586398 RepID=A0AAV2GUM2_9ROSI